MRRGLCVFIVLGLLTACAPLALAPGPAQFTPAIDGPAFVAADGTRLPLRAWIPTGAPKAIILALHGFNDYSRFFDDPGDFLARRGIASYAYDQRGFGAAPKPGTWAGAQAYARDAADAARAIKRRHPKLPLYLLGASMGGAVAMLAVTNPDQGQDRPRQDRPPVDGVILAAPAVWGRLTMPWYQRLALWIGARVAPEMALTGRGLGIVPSDNDAMLVRLGRDPLIIKRTRTATLFGLVNLMDAALAAAPRLTIPALILYGARDEIIPKAPTRRLLAALPTGPHRMALYQRGYHMLLRDLQAPTVWKDMAAWITDRRAPLPSKADRRSLSAKPE